MWKKFQLIIFLLYDIINYVKLHLILMEGFLMIKQIFNKLGAKVNTWNETKTSDFMHIEF